MTVPKEQKRNGLAEFFEKCTTNAKALIFIVAVGGGGLSGGLLLDSFVGVPQRVEANTVMVEANTEMIVAQDSAHRNIMIQSERVTKVFRDSILSVQGDILRTLRAWLCIESARLENRATVQCGLQQLLPSMDK